MKARQPPGPGVGDTYSMVSYSDTGSSTGSHGTSTTVSSARERLLWLIDLMEISLPGLKHPSHVWSGVLWLLRVLGWHPTLKATLYSSFPQGSKREAPSIVAAVLPWPEPPFPLWQ
uniref:Uncharacterized protein n=1 Tax=Mus musculus TaxID=10090 RepID=Q9CY67_MOUSE|nr:unnamed protein product [Mus musculus]